MWSDQLIHLADDVLRQLRDSGMTLVTAESCTGGLVSGLLTSLAGASDIVEGGFCTYSNALKQKALGVPSDLLDRHGAVSHEVASAMAKGALVASKASISVSLTGIAGPGGGTSEKPVGLVFIATAVRGGDAVVDKYLFDGNRETVRLQAVEQALLSVVARLH